MQSLPKLLERIILTLCEDTNTPRSLSVKLLVESGEYDQLFRLKVDPRHYLSAEDYFKDTTVTDFLRKLEMRIDGVDLEGNATQLFFDCEVQNAKSNVHLSRFVHGGPFVPVELRILPILAEMRKVAQDILGKLPSELDIRFGPGATFEDRGKLTTIPDKMSSRPTITAASRCLLPFWDSTAWKRAVILNRLDSDPLTVRGNRFTTVPKDALKRRGICIEPSINVSLQLAVGAIMKRRLRKAGLDLLTAQDKHRTIAQEASLKGNFATIDLSNASDTICREFVRLILPSDWFDLLDSLRSPFTLIKGKWVRLEKFSSMGNGYTFELETLLFSCLISAIANLRKEYVGTLGNGLYVYGDDIIVPTEIASDVVTLLSWFGLTPNPTKTFLDGCFRESCGGDFFLGVAVRPHFQKEDPDEPQKIIALANGLRRLYSDYSENKRSNPLVRRSSILRAWRRVLDSLPSRVRRLRGPVSLGDLVIHDDQHWCFRETSDKRGFILVYAPVEKVTPWCHWKPSVVLASALYGCTEIGVLSRGSVQGYRMKWISCLERETLA